MTSFSDVDRHFECIQDLLLRFERDGKDGSGYNSLLDAAKKSADLIGTARSLLGDCLCGQDLDIVAFGSLARFEITANSDLDSLIVSSSKLDRDQLVDVYERLAIVTAHNLKLSDPGQSGLFGPTIERDSLSENIGLQRDTNFDLTRRILFLEESVSLRDPEYHVETLKRILDSYLTVSKSNNEVPRFLLNDIIRYWRTLAVDFQAKAESGTKTALRYLKLITSRKACFVASLAPLIKMSFMEGLSSPRKIDYLLQEFQKPSLLRLLELMDYVAEKNPSMLSTCSRIVFILNSFVEKSGNDMWRMQIESDYEAHPIDDRSDFGMARAEGKALDDCFIDLFFEYPLVDFTKQYMVI